MRLLIISNMPHYRREGRIVGWGPTAQEIDHLAQLFEKVWHVACLHPEPAPANALPYTSERVELIPLHPSGGAGLSAKFGILRHLPQYAATIRRYLSLADVVHVRCPANISLVAIILLGLVRHPKTRWVKYAGNWSPTQPEAWSYTFQRRWLSRNLHRGLVTANGEWPRQPKHVYSFSNPCLHEPEIAEARRAAIGKQMASPVRLVFVGSLNKAKGVGRALHVLARLKDKGIPATLDLIGDGPQRPYFENESDKLKLGNSVTFHGWLPRTVLGPFYSRAHLMLFPTSCSEGWPKVLSEGMAYGAVPLSGNVSCIPQYLNKIGAGRTFAANDLEGYVDAISWYARHPVLWQAESNACVKAAPLFSYSTYLRNVSNMLTLDVKQNADAA